MSSTLSLEEDMENRQVLDYSIFSKWDINGSGTDELEQLKVLGTWKYCAEGNSNIVISLRDERRVIRLPKHNIGEQCEDINLKKKIFREVIFANQIFGPLLGSEFIGSVNLIRISGEQISQLNNSMRSIRPRNRLHKELGIPYATSRTDFARIHSLSSKIADYCVEIKPKQGCWSSKILGEKSNLCTFCLNQFLKLRQNKISARSEYCPLDLFSGNPKRLIYGVTCLLKNPQNNLRIFKNGELVYNENSTFESLVSVLDDWFPASNIVDQKLIDSSSFHNFLYLISTALLKPQRPLDPAEDASKTENRYESLRGQIKTALQSGELLEKSMLTKEDPNYICDGRTEALPERSLLERILWAQKLGQWGTESVYPLYRKICPIHHQNPESTCPTPACLVEDKWLDELQNLSISEVESLAIEHYLLAATIKDCSIMITFSPINPKMDELNKGETFLQDLRGGTHKIKIGVADLDPKPVTTIAKNYIRDLEMIQAYRSCNMPTSNRANIPKT